MIDPWSEVPEIVWIAVAILVIVAVAIIADQWGMPWPESIAPFFQDPPR